jgi:hypothetical protein
MASSVIELLASLARPGSSRTCSWPLRRSQATWIFKPVFYSKHDCFDVSRYAMDGKRLWSEKHGATDYGELLTFGGD